MPNEYKRLGWVGAGRMGLELVTRLLEAGCDVAVYNRTRSKAEPLAELGATIVDTPVELGDRDIVFTIVAGPTDFAQVVTGPDGLLSGDGKPSVIVDSTTIDAAASAKVRLAGLRPTRRSSTACSSALPPARYRLPA